MQKSACQSLADMNGEYCNVVTTQDLLLARRDGRTPYGDANVIGFHVGVTDFARSRNRFAAIVNT